METAWSYCVQNKREILLEQIQRFLQAISEV